MEIVILGSDVSEQELGWKQETEQGKRDPDMSLCWSLPWVTEAPSCWEVSERLWTAPLLP